MQNRSAVASAILLGVIVLAAIVVPWISPYNYYTPQWALLDLPPTLHGGHIFGTDDLGRDLLVRVMWGCRISLLIGMVASVVSVVIGVLWGAAAGFVGGHVDSVMMRIVDILYSVPFIPFVIMLVVMFGQKSVPDFCGHRRGLLAGHCPHCARPDAFAAKQGVHRSGARLRRERAGDRGAPPGARIFWESW